MEKMDNYKKGENSYIGTYEVKDFSLCNESIIQILENNSLDFFEDFSIYFSNIKEILNDNLSNENIGIIEDIITEYIEDIFFDYGFNLNSEFKFSYLAGKELKKIWNGINREEKFYDFFLKKFKKFIINKDFLEFPNIYGTIVYDKNDYGNFSFKYQYDHADRENGITQQLIDNTYKFNYKVLNLLQDKKLSIDEIYDISEDLLDFLSYEKEILSFELKYGNYMKQFIALDNFISEKSEYFYESSEENFMFYFLNIYGFISEGNLNSFGEFEKELYGNGYNLVSPEFYDEMKEKLYIFFEEIKNEEQAKN